MTETKYYMLFDGSLCIGVMEAPNRVVALSDAHLHLSHGRTKPDLMTRPATPAEVLGWHLGLAMDVAARFDTAASEHLNAALTSFVERFPNVEIPSFPRYWIAPLDEEMHHLFMPHLCDDDFYSLTGAQRALFHDVVTTVNGCLQVAPPPGVTGVVSDDRKTVTYSRDGISITLVAPSVRRPEMILMGFESREVDQ